MKNYKNSSLSEPIGCSEPDRLLSARQQPRPTGRPASPPARAAHHAPAMALAWLSPVFAPKPELLVLEPGGSGFQLNFSFSFLY